MWSLAVMRSEAEVRNLTSERQLIWVARPSTVRPQSICKSIVQPRVTRYFTISELLWNVAQ
jgi:hypothetical protein